jgi:membrane protease YdiL (CAAX protease family)
MLRAARFADAGGTGMLSRQMIMTTDSGTISDVRNTSPPCQPWGFWATTGFLLMAVVAWSAFQLVAALVVLQWLKSGGMAGASADTLMSDARTISIVTILAMPVPILVVAYAARRAGCTVVDYLALRWPKRAELIIGILIVAVLLPLGDLTSWLTGQDLIPPAVVDTYRSARDSGVIVLVLLAIALVIAAPLMEELLFRGFVLPGYARSPLGLPGAILLTAAGWAVMHIQYEWYYIGQIVVLGCVLGWLRWRSGSTILTIVLHAVVNAAALAQVAFVVERAS